MSSQIVLEARGNPFINKRTRFRSRHQSTLLWLLRTGVYAAVPILFLLGPGVSSGRAQTPTSSPVASIASVSNRERTDSRNVEPRGTGKDASLYEGSKRKKIELGRFSFSIPLGLKQREAEGIDSAIWRYADDNLSLLIDLGIYSAKPSGIKEEPEYREQRIRIDGRKATLVFFRSSDPEPNRPYVAAAYFPSIDGANSKLAFYATCASPYQQRVAREIFLSIDFKNVKVQSNSESSGPVRDYPIGSDQRIFVRKTSHPRKEALIARVIAEDAYLGLAQMDSMDVKGFIARVNDAGEENRPSRFIKIRYESHEPNNPLPSDLLDSKKVWKFTLSRNESCDQRVLDDLFQVPNNGGQLPKAGTYLLLENAGQDLPKTHSVIPCFVLRPGGVKPIKDKR